MHTCERNRKAAVVICMRTDAANCVCVCVCVSVCVCVCVCVCARFFSKSEIHSVILYQFLCNK